MQRFKSFRVAVYTLASVGLSVHANANISGSAWLVPDGGNMGSLCADNAVASCIPSSGANATFALSDNGLTAGFNNGGLNDSGGANPTADSSSITTLGAFINSDPDVVGGAAGVTYAHNASATTPLDNAQGVSPTTDFGACNTANNTCGTIFEFTGTTTVSTGEMFNTESDDGVSLYLGCNTPATCASITPVLTAPGPEDSTPHTSTYTGAPGTVSFLFVYAECCTLPATFVTNLASGGNNPTPEPTSILLLGTVMFGLVKVFRRKYSA